MTVVRVTHTPPREAEEIVLWAHTEAYVSVHATCTHLLKAHEKPQKAGRELSEGPLLSEQGPAARIQSARRKQ